MTQQRSEFQKRTLGAAMAMTTAMKELGWREVHFGPMLDGRTTRVDAWCGMCSSIGPMEIDLTTLDFENATAEEWNEFGAKVAQQCKDASGDIYLTLAPGQTDDSLMEGGCVLCGEKEDTTDIT